MYKLSKDKFQKARGGTSRVLEISCENCEKHLAYYQKDGPGLLKRMYIDRFIDSQPNGDRLVCQSCLSELGIRIIYKKENRPAFRLFAGAVTKRIVSRKDLDLLQEK